jgi:hypothetical protein
MQLAALLCAALWSASAAIAQPAGLDTGRIEQLTGLKGTLNEREGVFKVTFPRKDIEASVAGARMIPDLGLTAWAAFAGSEQLAIVDGDFAMLEGEVQGVLKALRAANINIVAIHNHMIGESPRYVFLHYWGVGPVEDLARGIRSALNTQARD